MRKHSRFWHGRMAGVCGASVQILRAWGACLLDAFMTRVTRPNLGSAGTGVIVQRGVTIRWPGQIRLGDYVRIGRNVEIDSDLHASRLVVGKGTWIGRECRIDFSGGLTIGEGCTLSENVTILTHDHGLSPRSEPCRRPLRIGDHVWIGAHVIILPNVSGIGDHSIIGAGSVVTRPVLPGSSVGGNPARLIHPVDSASAGDIGGDLPGSSDSGA